MKKLVFLFWVISSVWAPAHADTQTDAALRDLHQTVTENPVVDNFGDPNLEARARNLQRQLRCLVCQGESIDESGSPFAADIRQLVRRQIADGKSNEQIQDYLVARYGDFILMKPPLQSDTWLLWLAPFLVLGGGSAVAWMTVRKAAARAKAG